MIPGEPVVDDLNAILDPPKGIFGALRYMGPGLILSAAIVGSGELIATTTLGAKAGFSLLWVVLLGCAVKVAVQVEYGRFCIHHGLTSFQGWNRSANAGMRNVHWTIWAGVVYMLLNMAGQAGVIGGTAQVARFAWPALPLPMGLFLITLLIGLLIAHGRYGPVEAMSAFLNCLFVGGVLYCVVAIQWTPHAFSWSDLGSGLNFSLPRQTLGLAVAAFGITGVAAGEILLYPYWCLEKGYARWTGPREESDAWYARAAGWTRVMHIDALVSMAIYTLATCGFFILGATVLRSESNLRDGNEFIFQLSTMFGAVLGENARGIFMLCAFAVLFSTVFANAAGFSRVWADFFGLCGWIQWDDDRQRRRSIAAVAWLFPVICSVIYLAIPRPLLLVTFMGLCNALFLVVVAYQTVVFRYRHTDQKLRPSRTYDLALWVSLAAIGFMAVRSLMTL
jgi:Mn2+/Fe2+ NRAMP family transporter